MQIFDMTEKGAKCPECVKGFREEKVPKDNGSIEIRQIQTCMHCGKDQQSEETFYYAQSGDHLHLVNKDGKLIKEGFGTVVCSPCYKADFMKVYPNVMPTGVD